MAIKKKVVVEEVEEIFEEDIILEQVEETEPIVEAPVRQMTHEELKGIKMLREQRYRRFAQLAGLSEDEPLKESVKPSTPKVKLSLLSEGLRQEVKQLIKDGKKKMSQFPENIRKMISEEMASIEEFGMPAMRSEPDPDRALDSFAASLSVSVKSAITKHLGLTNNDPDMPNKANYIIDALVKRLKNPIQE